MDQFDGSASEIDEGLVVCQTVFDLFNKVWLEMTIIMQDAHAVDV